MYHSIVPCGPIMRPLTMKNFFREFVSIIFPPSKDQAYLASHHQTLRAGPFNWRVGTLNITSLLKYSDPFVQSTIRAAKFNNDTNAQKQLGELLASYLEINYSDYLFIPIPLCPARLRERGHNHIASILKAGNIDFLEEVLERDDRPPQTSLSRTERITNLNGSFHIKNPDLIIGKNLVLIDDVGTTGSTLNAAHKVTKLCNPASISLITLAH